MSVKLVLGTAGHIDHGKTTLIHALTGVDTDRLPEEKERGITIDLGFAPLDLGDGRSVSVVDVPGHEGLVRTMVAGASGIDLALIVIAADEGVMPQTREHIAICELLGIDHAVVALTKIDVADPDVAELAAEEAADLLRETSLAGARIIPVSAVSGEGVDDLRSALCELIDGSPARTPRSGPPRLNVDRCFAARGFGCVVTGTLTGSPFTVGDAVVIQPTALRARVRGLQHHGSAAQKGEPGVRCAINLQGIDVSDVSRGNVISTPDALQPSTTFDTRLSWLAAAPPAEGRVSIEFLVGTAERRAHIAPIGADSFEPGATCFARVHIDGEALTLLPGDRFIARGFARTEMAGSTVGGGVVLDIAPPHRRRSDPALVSELAKLAKGDPNADLEVRIERSGLAGISEDRLRRETGRQTEALAGPLAELATSEIALPTANRSWLAATAIAELERQLLVALDAYHASEPLRPGMPTSALRGRLPDNVPGDVAELALDRLVASGAVAITDDVAHLREHRLDLSDADQALVDRILAEAEKFALEPPSEREWSEALGISREHLLNLLAFLKREDRMVRAPGDLWFSTGAISALQERIEAHFETNQRLDTKAYKALIGTTRRTAVPLMEYFDDERLTIRSGDARVLRGR
jgi:selenocysteine-specific elongation factor